jgi:hypothetical protein
VGEPGGHVDGRRRFADTAFVVDDWNGRQHKRK